MLANKYLFRSLSYSKYNAFAYNLKKILQMRTLAFIFMYKLK